jgi:transcriptional regulator with XRE-family HTH domain
MDDLHRNLARRIRQLAREKGITLTHLADFSGRSRSHFWNVMGGSNSPTLTWLTSIANALEVEVRDLLETESPSPLREVTSLAVRLSPKRLRQLRDALRRETQP